MAASRARQEAMYGFPYHHLIDFTAEDYGHFSQTRNSPSGFRYASYLIRTIEELESIEFKSLIDVGCGDGYFLKHAARRFPEKTLVGVDVAEQAIQLAQALCGGPAQVGEALSYQCMDIANDSMDRQFDVATSIAVLEHIPPDELEEFVAAHRRIIKPGGYLIAVIPSKNLPIRNISRHYQHFDEASARALLSSSFEVQSVEFLNRDWFWGRIFSVILTNRMFILNHRGLRERLFRWYMRNCVRCDRRNGYMMIVRCRRPAS